MQCKRCAGLCAGTCRCGIHLSGVGFGPRMASALAPLGPLAEVDLTPHDATSPCMRRFRYGSSAASAPRRRLAHIGGSTGWPRAPAASASSIVSKPAARDCSVTHHVNHVQSGSHFAERYSSNDSLADMHRRSSELGRSPRLVIWAPGRLWQINRYLMAHYKRSARHVHCHQHSEPIDNHNHCMSAYRHVQQTTLWVLNTRLEGRPPEK